LKYNNKNFSKYIVVVSCYINYKINYKIVIHAITPQLWIYLHYVNIFITIKSTLNWP